MIEVVDKNGLRVMNADNEITCHYDNKIDLLAIDNADPEDMGSHRDNKERVKSGRALAYIKVKESGALLKFTANWLKPTEIIIRSEERSVGKECRL